MYGVRRGDVARTRRGNPFRSAILKFKLDENLGGRVGALFRASGHDVSSIPEQRMWSAIDSVVIAVCEREGRCLVTLDKEFGNPIIFPPPRYHGIALLRVADPITTWGIEDAILVLLSALREDSIDGKLWVVHKHLVRKYAPSE